MREPFGVAPCGGSPASLPKGCGPPMGGGGGGLLCAASGPGHISTSERRATSRPDTPPIGTPRRVLHRGNSAPASTPAAAHEQSEQMGERWCSPRSARTLPNRPGIGCLLCLRCCASCLRCLPGTEKPNGDSGLAKVFWLVSGVSGVSWSPPEGKPAPVARATGITAGAWGHRAGQQWQGLVLDLAPAQGMGLKSRGACFTVRPPTYAHKTAKSVGDWGFIESAPVSVNRAPENAP